MLLHRVEKNQETLKNHVQIAKKFGMQKIKGVLDEYREEFKRYLDASSLSSSQEIPAELTESWHIVKKSEADEARDIAYEILDFYEKYIEPYDNPEIRQGQEIIITQAELLQALGITPEKAAPSPQTEEVD